MTAIFYVLSGLLIVVLIAAGGAKLVGTARMRQGADRFGIPWPWYRLIGVLEVAAVVGIVIGFGWRPLGLAAGIGTGALMLGALSFHIRVRDPMPDMGGAVLTLLFAIGYLVTGFTAA